MSRALARAAAALWGFVRAVSGDAAYDAHLRHAGAQALSRQAFYLDSLERRYRGVNRCC